MRDAYTSLPAPVELSRDWSTHPMPGQQEFNLRIAGYRETTIAAAVRVTEGRALDWLPGVIGRGVR